MKHTFSLLNLLLGLTIVISPGMALGQPQEESVRPVSVVPTDEPALAPRPLTRSANIGTQSVLPTHQGKTTPSASTLNANALDFKSPLSP